VSNAHSPLSPPRGGSHLSMSPSACICSSLVGRHQPSPLSIRASPHQSHTSPLRRASLVSVHAHPLSSNQISTPHCGSCVPHRSMNTEQQPRDSASQEAPKRPWRAKPPSSPLAPAHAQPLQCPHDARVGRACHLLFAPAVFFSYPVITTVVCHGSLLYSTDHHGQAIVTR